MKYVIVIPDGCADQPQELLDGKTPLAAADTAAMDSIAASGIVGRANHTPQHLPAGSAVANMSLLGYDPVRHFTGRAPLEAAAQGIELGENDWAIRCNLVSIKDQVMSSFTAGHISSTEAKELLATARKNCDVSEIEFVPGVSYRNLVVYRPGVDRTAPFSMDTRTTPPHDLSDQSIEDDFPRGPGSELLANLMSSSGDWFADHPVNVARRQQGLPMATHCWLWGLGQQPKLEPFQKRYGKRGAMITAVDLLRGIAAQIGWERIEVPGATGYTDTDYAAKGRYAIEALAEFDIVCVHVEAPDEASHEGSVDKKIAALQAIDQEIVAPLFEHMKKLDRWRILVTPDHPTLISTKTHTHGDVPWAMSGSGIEPDDATEYSEASSAASEQAFDQGFKLMAKFLA